MPRTLLLLAIIVYISLSSPAVAGEWVTLTNCSLLENASNDGDSFHVMHDGEEYLFRLYFVDCPESEDSLPKRIEEQSRDFGLTPEKILPLGKLASNATQQFLSRPFNVITRWQKAPGRSRLQRHYAFVEIQNKIPDLAAVLLTDGLARLHGVKASPSPDLKPSEIAAIYENCEAEAKAARRGAWQSSLASIQAHDPNEKMYDYTTADGIVVKLKQISAPPMRSSEAIKFNAPYPSSTPLPVPPQLKR